ncbi:MAG: PxKF domain-containing protein [Verrucomicrobiae bacterium]|nr:PxKF domain-containing protein [Verrucomicrobiae bacterium]
MDPLTQTYFLSGSATGQPARQSPFRVFWENFQPQADEFARLLSPEAFTVSGNIIVRAFDGFIHAGGNVNGAIAFDSDSLTTLTGNKAVQFDYSGWSSALIDELENKALDGEVVGMLEGSPEFALTFRLLEPVEPEPLSWSGVLSPIRADGSSVFKAGRVVPVKFQLTGGDGGIVDLEARLYFTRLQGAEAGPINEARSPGAANSGNLFRYEPGSGEYIFNWSTKGLSAGTYRLELDLGDGVVREVLVGMR